MASPMEPSPRGGPPLSYKATLSIRLVVAMIVPSQGKRLVGSSSETLTTHHISLSEKEKYPTMGDNSFHAKMDPPLSN